MQGFIVNVRAGKTVGQKPEMSQMHACSDRYPGDPSRGVLAVIADARTFTVKPSRRLLKRPPGIAGAAAASPVTMQVTPWFRHASGGSGANRALADIGE